MMVSTALWILPICHLIMKRMMFLILNYFRYYYPMNLTSPNDLKKAK